MKQSWEWNKDRWGYDGVHTHEGKLVWFTHKHNPHGGGGACTQGFRDFLENGPKVSAPSEVLVELRASVEALLKGS
ncbi:hypothetical protein VSU19_23015 [Verrucomicrobiales bacterium BCK34]|nr:hypothetical protein [Verrucomicrobiales bacterium BCK34]